MCADTSGHEVMIGAVTTERPAADHPLIIKAVEKFRSEAMEAMAAGVFGHVEVRLHLQAGNPNNFTYGRLFSEKGSTR